MILNLTQHSASDEQIAEGVVNVPSECRERLTTLLTFDTLPSQEEIMARAEKLAEYAFRILRDSGDVLNGTEVMIGGAPFFMGPLTNALAECGLKAVFAFSRRESVETVIRHGDGTSQTRKSAVFRHLGFVR